MSLYSCNASEPSTQAHKPLLPHQVHRRLRKCILTPRGEQ